MQIRIDRDGEGNPTEIIAFVETEPDDAVYQYTDVDGDRLAVFTAVIPDVGPGINVKTDQFGSSFPLADIPALVEGIWSAAQTAAHNAGVLCPRPNCGPCSFDRATSKEPSDDHA